MIYPRLKEERDSEISAKINYDLPICLSSCRYARLVEMVSDDMCKSNVIYRDLKKRLQEPSPDLNKIKRIALGAIDTIDALTSMKFEPVFNPRDVTCNSYVPFMALRYELLTKNYSGFQEIADGIPIKADNEFSIVYQYEDAYRLDRRTDYCLIFDRKLPCGKEAVKKVIEDSELSSFVRKIMAEPFCYEINDTSEYEFDDIWKIYTIAIVSFWNPINKKDLEELFPEAFIPEQNHLHDYYEKFFLFQSHFRDFVSYDKDYR